MGKHRLLAVGLSAIALIAAQPRAEARPLSDEEAQALREEIARLRARVDDLEKRVGDAAPSPAAPTPQAAAPAPAPASGARIEWKGSPRTVEGDRAFKVKGRIQADANYVSAPDGLSDRGLGFSNEFRRIRLGGEGELGSGFGYKLELELSDNSVDLVDTFLTYRSGPWLLAIGNHNQFQSLDELISDTAGSVMERAAFTDAFNFERRLGLSAQFKRGALLAQAGVFTDDVGALANDSDGAEGGDENNSFSLDGRLVYAPKWGAAQWHFGASAHWRKLGRIDETPLRYRQRPFAHSTNSRLIGTRALRVEREFSHGLELGMVSGRWHAAAETHWLRPARLDGPSPRFWGGYAELGYYLTDDSRPYENGIFTTAKPKAPMGKGGIGAWQINLRYDHLDLDSRDIRGGTQDAYIAALIWTPIQYLRFNLNYGYLDYGGAVALPDGRTDYGVHVFGSRFELDF